MKKIFLYICLLMTSCGNKEALQVIVSNPLDLDRSGELVEVGMEQVSQCLSMDTTDRLVVINNTGHQVPYQVTSDGKLIFPAEVMAGSSATYTIQIGTPQEELFEKSVYGRKYPERVDDVAWENDRVAFRTYGPALQASGERAYGYDVWLKRVPELVVEDRYEKELTQSISYHEDHGNGLDCYKVGSTLGSGATALLVGDSLIYPYCYVGEPEILDNGPLRFTMKLHYAPTKVKEDAAVVETRIITLDKGSHLNKTTVTYTGLTKPFPVAAGIVIHPENPEAYFLDTGNGYVTYTDLSDNIRNGNGEIYIGVAFPDEMKEAIPVFFSEEESKTLRGGALGHVLAITDYQPDSKFTYYWGNGWSKYGFADAAAWNAYMKVFSQKVRHPLQVEVD